MKRKWLALCLAAAMTSLSVAQTAAAAEMEPDIFISEEDEVFDDSFAAEEEEIVFEDEDPVLESEEFLDGEMSEEPAFDSEEEIAFAEEGDSQEYITAAYVSEEQFNKWKEDGTEPDMEKLTCVTGSTANIFELLEKDGGTSTGYCLMGGMDLDNQPYGELTVPDGLQAGIMGWDGLRLKKVKASGNLVLKTGIATPGSLELDGEMVLDGASVWGVVKGVGSADVIHLTDWSDIGGLQGVEKFSFEEKGQDICFTKGSGPIEFYEIDNSLVNYESQNCRNAWINIEGYSKDRVPVFHKTFDFGMEYYEDGNSGPGGIDIHYIESFDVPEGQDWKFVDLAEGSRVAAFAGLSDADIIEIANRLHANASDTYHYNLDMDGNAYKEVYDSEEFWNSIYSISRYVGDEKYTAQQNFENFGRDEISENWRQEIYWAKTPEMVSKIINVDAANNPGSYYYVVLPRGGEIGTLTVPSGAAGVKYEANNIWDEKTETETRIPVKLSAIQVPEGKILSLLGVDTASGNLSITGAGMTDLIRCKLKQNITAENLQVDRSVVIVKSLKCKNIYLKMCDLAVSDYLEFDQMFRYYCGITLKSSACLNMGNVKQDGGEDVVIFCENKGKNAPSIYLNGTLDLGKWTNEEGESGDCGISLVHYSYEDSKAAKHPLAEDMFSGSFSVWEEGGTGPYTFGAKVPDTEKAILTLGKDATANRASLAQIHVSYKNVGLSFAADAEAAGNRVYLIDDETGKASKAYVALDGAAVKGNVATASVSSIKDQVYTGKAFKPAVTVTCNGVKLISGTDYTLKYSSNKNIGTAKITITGKGDYIGTKTVSFAIVPKKGTSYTVSGLKYKITKTASKNGTVTLTAPSKNTNTKVTVPDTVKIKGFTFKVTAIANDAFKNNTKLASVVIGKNVTAIGKQAFSGCKALKSITIKGTGLKTVGANALKGISSKAVIKVPSSKLSAYKKLLKGKGQASGVKIQK